MKTVAATLLLVLICVGLASCSWRIRPPIDRGSDHFSVMNSPGLSSIRRVIVFPFFRGSASGSAAEGLDQSMPRAWRALNRFEVVQVDADERDALFPEDVLRSNRISSDSLRRVRETYLADAVLVGRIEHVESYDPVGIGLTAHLFSCRDGSVLWSGSGEWDGSDYDVQMDLRDWYHDRQGSANERIGGWKAVLSSPRAFARYVSDQLAESVRAPQNQ
jgi:hypothetical protein